jgi:dolichyl-phosphate beta-glucosyltransferase
MKHRCVIAVPCYNEAERLDQNAFVTYAAQSPHLRFVFVNDGSNDATLDVLYGLQAQAKNIHVLNNPVNIGKAESVRCGMRYALSLPQAEIIGFWDADLATPLSAIDNLLEVFGEHPAIDVVIGSRVKLLGREISRRPHRHYLGRIFATLASISLDLPVYDTQCGAKLFRANEVLTAALESPFLSRWIFDVELLARFIELRSSGAVLDSTYEYPLHCWRDVPGSKVNASAFAKAAAELWRIHRRYRRKAEDALTCNSAPVPNAETALTPKR